MLNCSRILFKQEACKAILLFLFTGDTTIHADRFLCPGSSYIWNVPHDFQNPTSNNSTVIIGHTVTMKDGGILFSNFTGREF